jgi:hypothetical protein
MHTNKAPTNNGPAASSTALFLADELECEDRPTCDYSTHIVCSIDANAVPGAVSTGLPDIATLTWHDGDSSC